MLVALDFVAHWSEDEPKWRGPTNRMARAWAKNVALIEVLVFEEERGANARLARELPHPRVAVDASGALSVWLKARGVDFLPQSLVFGGDGKLLFSGQPFELPEVVAQVLAGRFDAHKVYALQQKRDAELPARRKLVARIGELEKAGKWRDAIALIDAEAEQFVSENRAGLLVRRFKILHKSDVPAALAYGNALEREPISQSFGWLLHDLALEIAREAESEPRRACVGDRADRAALQEDAHASLVLGHARRTEVQSGRRRRGAFSPGKRRPQSGKSARPDRPGARVDPALAKDLPHRI